MDREKKILEKGQGNTRKSIRRPREKAEIAPKAPRLVDAG